MNAEIYLLRGGSASSACGKESFNRQMKALAEHNVCVLYKTAVDNNENSLKEALKLSFGDDEGIDVIVIADAIEESSRQNAEDFFSIFEVKNKDIREISAEVDMPILKTGIDNSEIEISSHSEENESKAEKKTVNVYSARVGGKKMELRLLFFRKLNLRELSFQIYFMLQYIVLA